MLLLVASISFFSCEKTTLYSENKNFNKKPVQTLKHITLYRSDNGEVYAKLLSSLVEYYTGDSARTVFPKGIKVNFFNKDGSDKSFLTALYAINYTNNANLVYIKDSVRIINFSTKDTIYCKDLFWDQDKRIVYSRKPIKRFSPNGEDFGKGLTANENFDSVVIISPSGTEIFTEQDTD